MKRVCRRLSVHFKDHFREMSLSLLVAFGIAAGSGGAVADEEQLAQRLSKLERALDNQGLLDMFERLEALQSEVQTLRGQIEEQQYTIERLRESQRNAYVDLDRRMQESLQFRGSGAPSETDSNVNPPLTVYQPGSQPEVAGTPAPGIDVRVQQSPAVETPQTGPYTARVPDESTLPPSTDPQQSNTMSPDSGVDQGMAEESGAANALVARQSPPSQNADQAYREAFGLLKAGKYDESIEAFNLFLLDYPNSEYADNSQYWLGETYFVKQDYPAAIEQYQKLITNYPASKKQSHALLKIGYSFQRLGELDKARAVLEDLQTRYPGSTAARLAAERVQQIAADTP